MKSDEVPKYGSKHRNAYFILFLAQDLGFHENVSYYFAIPVLATASHFLHKAASGVFQTMEMSVLKNPRLLDRILC